MFNIKEQLKLLPDKPGVYLMKDRYDNIIYVGKAIILKNRVRQYFRSYNNHSSKVKAMVSNIISFEYIITDNELEALILECNLIKKYRPKYNILLRDDKTYPYIKITVNEDYPRVLKVRKIINDKSKYFGPYTNITAVNITLDILNNIYPIRTCNIDINRAIKHGMRPCLEYYINNCIGPCTGKVTKEEYKKYIDEIISFLNGKSNKVVDQLREKMIKAANEQRFEDAADYRDKLKSIDETLTAQKITKANNTQDRDVVAIASNGDIGCIETFFIRNGRVVGRENFILEGILDETNEDSISNFLKQFYSSQKYIPNEILVECINYEKENIESMLISISGHNVTITVPKRGEKYELINLVKKNAIEYLNKFVKPKYKKEKTNIYVLEEIKRILALDEIPSRIEAYDISNIQGVDSVGAMVVYTDGKKDRHEYRRFKIKTIHGANDVGSLTEVISRRLKYGNYPDLILIDGGINQINAVTDVIDSMGMSIEVWGMYKDDRHRTDGLINRECKIKLDRNTNIYRFVASIQEEVHRYAITFHRSIRENNVTKSILDDIDGIGKVKKLALLNKFKTIDNIKNASITDLVSIKGINEKLANNILHKLNNWR